MLPSPRGRPPNVEKCGRGRKGIIANEEAIKTSGGKGQSVIISPRDFNISTFS